jgi:hypothetical protein
MPDETVTLPVRCVQCQYAHRLVMADWPEPGQPHSHLRLQAWRCPSCRQINRGDMPGRIVEVRLGFSVPKEE